ncbi:GNAT family N-acetyltransferase [Micromonospora sp. NBC_01796]|uniref:GNAT family N-acetyltransferase n=1 Tax=Micromonospora sp. NBC_01796 TaxID=2975987 RepID=UPI002DD86349|nr:GNAT family N-acetyltransferase [Micromonospora sp. NBC_01796]WSA89000.1 GNAT family N-acetyltransferase [Micromonospora sp. NBC_01796]
MTSLPASATTAPPEASDPRPVVRRIRPADTARMRALRLEMLADSPLAFLETVAEAAARPHAEYANRVRQNAFGSQIAAFVAEPPSGHPDRRLVGHAGGHAAPAEPGLTVIFAVYLTPTWRGTGLLADLIEAVAAWSRASGRPELMLEVVVGNNRAIRAYQRLGFVDTGVRLPHPRIAALTELQLRRRA